MSTPSQIYRPNLSLLTDLYQLTMAHGYWKAGIAEHEAVFTLFFRKHPFDGGYTIACGLADALDYVESYRFDADDLEYLAGLKGNDDRPLFDRAFVDHLEHVQLRCTVDAVAEGTPIFPFEPMVRVTGPLWQCQLLETPLLTILNFQTLIATKAARICSAARGEPVLEFGLRRAQGIDGGLAAARAAYVGGCTATSNVLAGRLYDIPVRGTHAHSWVMCFDDELAAFRAYAEAMPNNCVFLVDTYDTLDGVRRAITVGRELRDSGHEMIGVRLDSGDLAYLSIEARRLLDEGGFPDAAIVASNELDENVLLSLEQQGAKIDVWGIGTKLVTGYDSPALGGVYKLTAIREPGGPWAHRIKLSEQAIKITNPGRIQIRRFSDGDEYRGDALWDELTPPGEPWVIVDPMDPTRRKEMAGSLDHADLLRPVFRDGKPCAAVSSLDDLRARVVSELERLHEGVRRFVNPHEYPVGLEQRLHELKTGLVLRAREQVHTTGE